jgi:hypothetical protein
LSEIDVSEWEITYMEIRPREGKRSYDSSKTTQLLEGETRSQVDILGTQKGKKLCIVKKDQQQVSELKKFLPRLCYNCGQPGHFKRNCPNPKQHKPQQQNQNPGATKGDHDQKPIFHNQTSLTLWVTSLSENTSPLRLVILNLGTRFFLRG